MEDRPPLGITSATLSMALRRNGEDLASISEYAKKTGLDTVEVLEHLRPLLKIKALRIEEVNGEMFLHTAGSSRPAPLHLPEVPFNQWELLRSRFTLHEAYEAWALMRKLEAAGWRTEASPARVMAMLGRVSEDPVCGIVLGNPATGERVLPVMPEPDPTSLGERGGVLEVYEAAGAAAIALTCRAGDMDKLIGSVTVWVESRYKRPLLKVYILEAPKFNPVLLSPDDAAIEARTVARKDI